MWLEFGLRDDRHFESSESCGEVNRLIDWCSGKRMPAINLAHVDLPGSEQGQNNIAAVSADGSTVYVLIQRLNSSCSCSIAFVVRALRH
jgi:hypothetical protein